jgi:thiamine biosynthesis lipoprotein
MTAASEAPPRTLHVEHAMGTVFTIDIRDAGAWHAAVDEAVAWLHQVDRVFSTYRDDSDINRLRRGDAGIGDVHPDVADVLDLCMAVETETDGAFSAFLHGELDPTGLVKGWAIERASDILRAHGSADHAVNGGGDIQTAGEPSPGEPWRIGVSDPLDRTRLRSMVSGRDLAVATSGVAERGAHIVDPRTGAPVTGLVSATVTGRSLTRVDAYATAAFTMGAQQALDWLERLPGYEGLVVLPDGRAWCTSGFEQEH